MTFNGTHILKTTPENAFAKLGDGAFLVTCLGKLEESTASSDRAEWKMKPHLLFLSGTVSGSLEIVERVEPGTLRIQQNIKGSGFSAKAEVALQLQQHADGTLAAWQATVLEKTGLLKMVPGTMIQTAALKAVADIWQEVDAKL